MSYNTLNARLISRSDTAANWTSNNPVLLRGEIGVEIDTRKIKIGDGSTVWTSLLYANSRPEDGDMKKSVYDVNNDGIVDVAAKVSNKLTIGSKQYDGSSAVSIVLSDLGTITASSLSPGATINGVLFTGASNITIYDSTKLATALLGQPNGVASLDDDGKVPSTQLPSYVDDIIEIENSDWFTTNTGEQGKIYVALDTNKTWRWSGTTWVEVSNTLDYASQSEAELGTENTKVMTSLRVAQAITKQAAKSVKITGSSTELKDANGNVVLPAYPTTLPPNGSAGGDLSGTYPNPTIAANAITEAKIAAGAVTNPKIVSLEATKLYHDSGNYTVFNGGTSASTF